MHETIKQTHFFLMEGYKTKAFPLPFAETTVPSVEQWLIKLQKARDKALATHELAQQKVIKQITQEFISFRKGEQVWLEERNLKMLYTSKKITPK
jgi:hypothetical protein